MKERECQDICPWTESWEKGVMNQDNDSEQISNSKKLSRKKKKIVSYSFDLNRIEIFCMSSWCEETHHHFRLEAILNESMG